MGPGRQAALRPSRGFDLAFGQRELIVAGQLLYCARRLGLDPLSSIVTNPLLSVLSIWLRVFCWNQVPCLFTV